MTIAGMAAVTYLTRICGFALSDKITAMPKMLDRFLKYIPGTIIVSIIAPQIANGGKTSFCAAVICFLVAVKFKNMILVMTAGVATIYLLRNHTFF